MEQHAVPQDITGFKFKLVGDMTLKQFGELAGGAILAYVFYIANWHPVLKYPFAIFFALFGVALAFLPIEERPLDIWLVNFFRAIYKPTVYIWKRQGSKTAAPTEKKSLPSAPQLNFTPITMAQPQNTSAPKPPEGGGEINVQQLMANRTTLPLTDTTPVTPPVQEDLSRQTIVSIDALEKIRQEKLNEPKDNIPPKEVVTIDALEARRRATSAEKLEKNASELTKNEALVDELVNQSKALMMQIDELKNSLVLVGKLSPREQEKLDALTLEKSKLSSQITNLRSQITSQRVAPLTTTAYQMPVIERRPPQIRVVDKVIKPPTPITLTEIPNVINGVVLDQNNNPIDGTIIIIKDKAGNSIRALKANKVGQFIGSTPLENGTYYLELEKQNFNFDLLEITLSGGVMPPLEIKPKIAVT